MTKPDYAIRRLGAARYDSPLGDACFLEADAAILVDATMTACRDCNGVPAALEQAGPRRELFFDPGACRIAAVTCGGLCPGLNDVIRAITMVAWYRYGVRDILGLRYGYEGLVASAGNEPMVLSPEVVEDIHQHGGTILGSSRGAQDIGDMVDFLIDRKIDVLFTIGGDGTQRGALALTEEIGRRGLAIAVVGIPKTIDNDVRFTERTFGFETAVAMSQVPITCAHMEAKGAKNGVGLVTLMGRQSGFVAAYATLASSDVNLVLVPEVPFAMNTMLDFLRERLSRKSHAVIVAAEGAGQDLVPPVGRNESGNVVFGDIGLFLKEAITRHFRDLGIPCTVKHIDPSYTIRSAPASADDSVFCFQLAENAVHAAMTGRTGLVTGLWNGHFVHVPMEKTVSGCKQIDTTSLLWQSVLDNTGQPRSLSDFAP